MKKEKKKKKEKIKKKEKKEKKKKTKKQKQKVSPPFCLSKRIYLFQSDSECRRNNMSQTYPFNSWEEYYTVFVEEYSGNSQLRYGKIVDIIKYLLEKGNDAQQGLDMFFQSMIDADRYANELIIYGTFTKIVNLFLEKGAVIHIDTILGRTKTSPQYFEKAMCGYSMRAHMLRTIKKQFIPDLESILNEKIGWDAIESMYWEDMIDREDLYLDPSHERFETVGYKQLKFDYYGFYND